MNLSQQIATYGLRAIATPQGTNVANDVQIGIGSTLESLTTVDQIYSLKGWVAAASTLDVDLTTGTATYTATEGTAQVETATAAGSITASGNASVVVTASGMTGSPKTISVAVLNGDTAAQWADKVRIALAADTAVSALFDVSGTSTAIILTRKPIATQTLDGYSKSFYAANDGTLNISLDNGTCTGITTAATSANTTAGVATSGGSIVDGDGKDFEGYDLVTGSVKAILIKSQGTVSAYDAAPSFTSEITNGVTLTLGQEGISDLTFEGTGDLADGGAVFSLTVALS